MKSRVINNATAVYVIMMAVFAAGIWAVLAYGSTLEAQPDLAGDWELVAANSSGAPRLNATIDQSGRYVRMKFKSPNEASFDLRIKKRDAYPASSVTLGRPIIMAARTGGDVTFAPTADPDVFKLSLPDGRSFVANFVTRTHGASRASSASKPSSAAH